MVKTPGIVFRSMKYRETSLIVDIYTKELGNRSYLINGVRSPKSKSSASILQAMTQLDLLVYDKAGPGKLNRIKEYKLGRYYNKIPFQVIRSMIGQFMIEVFRKCVRDDDGNIEMYNFIIDWFDFLDTTEHSVKNIIPVFLIELASKEGFAIDNSKTQKDAYFDLKEGHFTQEIPEDLYYLDKNLSSILYSLSTTKRTDAYEIKISGKQRSILIDQLIIFFRLHIESFGEIKSLDILRSIIS